MKTTIRSLLIVALLCSAAAIPQAQAVVPAPDGGYPGGNTAEGQNALFSRTTGGYNTGVGYLSLRSDSIGSFNTAVGAGTLLANTADQNTAVGTAALLFNTTGALNTAGGAFALFNNTTGVQNTALGGYSLYRNTTAGSNTTGANTAVGAFALLNATTSGTNTAVGYDALGSLTESPGGANTALGDVAGFNITGIGNICIGAGVRGLAGENNTVRIGDNLPNTTGQSACYIGGIYGQLYGVNGTPCYVDPDGKLSVFFSARRFKTDIVDMGATSEALLALRPVTFHYKPEMDKTGVRHFGLVAEEVAAVNPDLVTRDAKGELATVRYEAVNAMLLNEFLKEHCKVEDQSRRIQQQDANIADLNATIAEQRKATEVLTARLNEQATQIEKVSTQMQTMMAVPKLVARTP